MYIVAIIEEAREIRHAASQAIILRYTWRECIEHIKSKTGHDLSKTAFFKIKKQLKSKGRDWVLRLRDDHDEFLSEYRQIVFAFIGSVSSIPIAFTAHIGGFLAGVILTKFLVRREDSSRREPERTEEGGY